MHSPDVYLKVNWLQRNDAKTVIYDYNKRFLKWPTNGLCSALDIGCGPGDVTHEFLLPILPANFIKLDAVDISKEMLEHAKANYNHPKLKFHQLDINTNNIQKFIDCNGKYDFIFSFYCIHWLPDQWHVMTNVYNLLNENGQALITLCTSCGLYESYVALSIDPKWRPFMMDAKRYLPEYIFLPNSPDIEFATITKEIGFKNSIIKYVPRSFEFNDELSYRDFIYSVSPFIHRINIENQAEYVTETINFIRKRDKLDKFSLTFQYFTLVAYLQK